MIHTVLITSYDKQCNYHYILYFKALKAEKKMLESFHLLTANTVHRSKKGMSGTAKRRENEVNENADQLRTCYKTGGKFVGYFPL